MSEAHVSDRIEVAAKTIKLAKVREFLHQTIKRSLLPAADINKVVLAVDEAVANTIQHGYAGRDDGTVEIVIAADDKRFQVIIRDRGVSFDTAAKSRERSGMDVSKHVNQGSKRGLGLFIMRRVMDEVLYSSKEGEINELTLVKYIGPKP